MANGLPRWRLAAHDGDPDANSAATTALLDLLTETDRVVAGISDPYRRRPLVTARDLLHEQLPLVARPEVEDLAALRRRNDLVVLEVAYYPMRSDEPAAMELRDILVTSALRSRGHGLGTTVLQELLRFADRRQLPVTGTFVPLIPSSGGWVGEHDLDATGSPRRLPSDLARWYARHGFHPTLGEPAHWPSSCGICRPPAPRAAGRSTHLDLGT